MRLLANRSVCPLELPAPRSQKLELLLLLLALAGVSGLLTPPLTVIMWTILGIYVVTGQLVVDYAAQEVASGITTTLFFFLPPWVYRKRRCAGKFIILHFFFSLLLYSHKAAVFFEFSDPVYFLFMQLMTLFTLYQLVRLGCYFAAFLGAIGFIYIR